MYFWQKSNSNYVLKNKDILIWYIKFFLALGVMMQHEMIYYSLDPKISLSEIRDGWFSDYDVHKYFKLQERIIDNDIWAMMDSDIDFHHRLFSIRPRVQCFYYLGDLSLLNQKILGIVGPRAMSSYGKQVLEKLFSFALEYDFVTISGMAEGIDQLCHTLSREHTIPTIAILGWGLGRYLKRPEWAIIREIVADGGLVISEYKLWERPTQYTFPQRNRLIAWLSDIIFLPEAGEKSGSLITVDCALAMKKPVYATPNSIFSSTSAGILQRIEAGNVQPIFDLQNFLATHFTPKHTSSRPLSTIILSDQEQWLISVLSHDQWTEIHSLIQETWADIQELIQLLTLLEIKGLVVQDVPGRYCRR
jgi:DNA processing protein